MFASCVCLLFAVGFGCCDVWPVDVLLGFMVGVWFVLRCWVLYGIVPIACGVPCYVRLLV